MRVSSYFARDVTTTSETPTRQRSADPPRTTGAAGGPRRLRFTPALAGILAASFTLRVTSIQHGLPFVYNPDEELHFVPHAAEAADGDWNPRYFDNPSALTYLIAFVFKAVFHGEDVTQRLANDPTAVFTVGRVVVAAVGTLVVLLVHWAGTRFFGHLVGLIGAALVGFGFLPVFYSHQALNDVATMAPVTVALVGCLLIYERGTSWTYLLAGGAVGVAAGTKYLAAPMALVVALAALLVVLERRERPARALLLLAAAGLTCVAGLIATNPYLLLEFGMAKDQFSGQSTHVATEKLGQDGVAWLYYPHSLLWGFGVLPLVLAAAGAVLALRSERTRGLLLLGFPIALYIYMGTQERFFGRWLLPAYPMLAILAGYALVRGAEWLRSRPRVADTAAAALVLPALAAVSVAQPAFDSFRSDVVLARTDTRDLAAHWIRTHLEGDRRIVVEPGVPASYREAAGITAYPVRRPYQAYETRLRPEVIDAYRDDGYCWVLVSSHQRDRGLAAGLSGARAYYERLERETDHTVVFSPYRPGASPPDFSYDMSFNWYPLAFGRPGPYLELRHLTDCLGSRP